MQMNYLRLIGNKPCFEREGLHIRLFLAYFPYLNLFRMFLEMLIGVFSDVGNKWLITHPGEEAWLKNLFFREILDLLEQMPVDCLPIIKYSPSRHILIILKVSSFR